MPCYEVVLLLVTEDKLTLSSSSELGRHELLSPSLAYSRAVQASSLFDLCSTLIRLVNSIVVEGERIRVLTLACVRGVVNIVRVIVLGRPIISLGFSVPLESIAWSSLYWQYVWRSVSFSSLGSG